MKRLLALLVILLSASVARATAEESVSSRQYKLPQLAPQTAYTRVRGNPRRPEPLSGWSEALQYMAYSPGFYNDLNYRLALGLPPEYRQMYRDKVAAEVIRIIGLAIDHHYMMGDCPKCGHACRVKADLASLLERVEINPGEVFTAVTEGRSGAVRFNRRFEDHRRTFWRFRFNLQNLLMKVVQRPDLRQTFELYASTHVDLIVECGNAALGEFELTEVTRAELKPCVKVIEKEKVVYRERVVERPVLPPQEGFSYTPPGQSTYYIRETQAGWVTGQVRTNVRVKQQQQQQQQQEQEQKLKNDVTNINQNLNQNPISIAIGGSGGK